MGRHNCSLPNHGGDQSVGGRLAQYRRRLLVLRLRRVGSRALVRYGDTMEGAEAMSYCQIGKNCLLALAVAALTGCGCANQAAGMNPTWRQVVDDAVRREGQ